jgi:hypothetical protein
MEQPLLQLFGAVAEVRSMASMHGQARAGIVLDSSVM